MLKMKRREHHNNGIHSIVEYSPCSNYRYGLTRSWDLEKPRLLVILLNPSNANEKYDDPTTIRCVRRAVKLGFGSMRICNLFSIINRSPKLALLNAQPVGHHTDSIIEEACHWLKRSFKTRNLWVG